MEEERFVPRPAPLLAAAAVGAIEAAAIIAYALAIGVSAIGTRSDVAAAPVEIVVYLAFAVGMGLIVKGLLNRRRIARSPFVLAQLFGLIVGWTLTQGDGGVVHLIGYVVLVIAVIGIALVLNPAVGEALSD